MLCSLSTSVFAETKQLDLNAESNITKLKINEIFVTVPYNPSKIKVEKKFENGFQRIEIIDKATGEILEAYGEKIECLNSTPLQNLQTENLTNSQTVHNNYSESLIEFNKSFNLIQKENGGYYLHTIYKERKDGPAISRLYTVLKIYSYNSFRQIDSVENKYWSEASSGSWELTNRQATSISTSGKFPTIEIETSGTATITVTTTDSQSGGFSFSALESAGFTFSGSSSSNYYYRKSIDLTHRYSLF